MNKKLVSLNSSTFDMLSKNELSSVKGGYLVSCTTRDTSTGEVYKDRDTYDDKTNLFVCRETCINGVWY